MAMKGSKGISILGATGSIGRSTLELVRRHPERFKVVSLAARNSTSDLLKLINEFSPEFVAVFSSEAARELREKVPPGVEVASGPEASSRAATMDGVDMVVSAISGAAGLVPTLAAIRAGKDIALANKETLVLAGSIVTREVERTGVRLLPVDSEHSALFQSLQGHRPEDVRRVILTASGGPFLNTAPDELERVTPQQALKHPKWSMGPKITVDSATLVNKGLEVIEASWLFGLPPEKISVVVHPQSIVHSMVEYVDGSVISQMGVPDMKGPIAYALGYPERIEDAAPALELAGTTLEFMEPDTERFPCLSLAYRALERGGVVPAALNAADEVAVEMFLKGAISFTDIYRVIRDVVEWCPDTEPAGLDDVLEADRKARERATVAAGKTPSR